MSTRRRRVAAELIYASVLPSNITTNFPAGICRCNTCKCPSASDRFRNRPTTTRCIPGKSRTTIQGANRSRYDIVIYSNCKAKCELVLRDRSHPSHSPIISVAYCQQINPTANDDNKQHLRHDPPLTQSEAWEGQVKHSDKFWKPTTSAKINWLSQWVSIAPMSAVGSVKAEIPVQKLRSKSNKPSKKSILQPPKRLSNCICMNQAKPIRVKV
jgi:hypothetical protein